MKDAYLKVLLQLIPLLFVLTPVWVCAQDAIVLPEPRLTAGRPLMDALSNRKSTRVFSRQDLPVRVLGEMLWAGFGVNRPETRMRTAPSAHNRQEIDIYVALRQGLFLYNAFAHRLDPVADQDVRALTGKQKFPGDAPANLIYVVNFERMDGVPRQAAIEAAAVSTGAIVQNVYLYCASEGLAAVVRGWIDREALGKAMGLNNNHYIVVAQTVGYPGK